MMKWKTIGALLLLTPLLSGCMTMGLSEKIERSKSANTIDKDSLYAMRASSNGMEKRNTLSLVGDKYTYQITSDGEALADFLAKGDVGNIIDINYLSFYAGLTTFHVNSKHKFSSNGPIEISYIVRDRQLTEKEKQVLIASGFRLYQGDERPELIYRMNYVSGVLQSKSGGKDKVTFLPATINLEKEGSKFSALGLLYPFALVGDVVTAPFQLIGYFIVINNLPAMRY